MNAKPRERPILMNTWSVQRILSGDKVQTRRVLKVPNPETIKVENGMIYHRPSTPEGELIGPWYEWQPTTYSPYGAQGSRLWIRETWATIPLYDVMKPSQLGRSVDLFWKADDAQTRYNKTEPGRWRSGMFMPKWAARLFLELDEVRVERVQEISAEDCYAEGIPEMIDTGGVTPQGYFIEISNPDPVGDFAQLWEGINKHRGYGWEANPWVWCLTFHMVERRDK